MVPASPDHDQDTPEAVATAYTTYEAWLRGQPLADRTKAAYLSHTRAFSVGWRPSTTASRSYPTTPPGWLLWTRGRGRMRCQADPMVSWTEEASASTPARDRPACEELCLHALVEHPERTQWGRDDFLGLRHLRPGHEVPRRILPEQTGSTNKPAATSTATRLT